MEMSSARPVRLIPAGSDIDDPILPTQRPVLDPRYPALAIQKILPYAIYWTGDIRTPIGCFRRWLVASTAVPLHHRRHHKLRGRCSHLACPVGLCRNTTGVTSTVRIAWPPAGRRPGHECHVSTEWRATSSVARSRNHLVPQPPVTVPPMGVRHLAAWSTGPP
jgi:hypothetical protein